MSSVKVGIIFKKIQDTDWPRRFVFLPGSSHKNLKKNS